MEAVEKNLAEAVIRYLCLNGEINGVRFGPHLQILLGANDGYKKGIKGQVYLNAERWCIFDEFPNKFPEKETDIEEMQRIEELAILNELSYIEIVDVKLCDTIPHLIFTFRNGKCLFIYGYHEWYESWQLGVSFQPDDTWLVVACPDAEIAIWCLDSFYSGKV